MEIIYGNRKRKIRVKETGFISKGIGLMFRTKDAENLLFDFRRNIRTPLTALFVFFPFLVLWLNERNEVVDFRIAKPFEIHINTKKKFRKIIEIPMNFKNKEHIEFFINGKIK